MKIPLRFINEQNGRDVWLVVGEEKGDKGEVSLETVTSLVYRDDAFYVINSNIDIACLVDRDMWMEL